MNFIVKVSKNTSVYRRLIGQKRVSITVDGVVLTKRPNKEFSSDILTDLPANLANVPYLDVAIIAELPGAVSPIKESEVIAPVEKAAVKGRLTIKKPVVSRDD